MYHKGDLMSTHINYDDNVVDEDKIVLYDARLNKGEKIPKLAAYLLHSCDEWVIGGKENAEALIADLQDWIKNQF